MDSPTNLSDRRYKSFLGSFNFYYKYNPPALAFIQVAENKNGGEGIAEEVIERKIREIKDSKDIDIQEKEQEIANLSTKLRTYLDYREEHSKPESKTKWDKATPAISPNQKVKPDIAEPVQDDAVVIPKGPHYKTVDSRIYASFRKGKCHHNATALLVLLIIEQSYRSKNDTHHTWKYWRLKRGLVASSMGQSTMAKTLGVSIPSIKRYIKALVDNGDIRIEVQNRENVYILGEARSKNPKDDYFYYMRASEENE